MKLSNMIRRYVELDVIASEIAEQIFQLTEVADADHNMDDIFQARRNYYFRLIDVEKEHDDLELRIERRINK